MDTSPAPSLFSTKSNGKTYERNKPKYPKNTENENGSNRNTQQKSNEHSLLAAEVAKLLNPTIEKAIQSAIGKALEHLQGTISSLSDNLTSQNRQMQELQNLVSDIQDDTISTSTRLDDLEKKTKDMQAKIDDLENRTRRNNLRFIGIPESYKISDIVSFITTVIPKKLGIDQNLTNIRLERVHRIGPLRDQVPLKPRAVIAKFLDYSEKTLLLQAYKKNHTMEFDGFRVLIFQDYSILLSQKRKEFSIICQSLFKMNIKFALTYPSILKIFLATETRTFENPKDASNFILQLQKQHSSSAAVQERGSSPGISAKDRRQEIKTFSRHSQKFQNMTLSTVPRSRSRSPIIQEHSNPDNMMS